MVFRTTLIVLVVLFISGCKGLVKSKSDSLQEQAVNINIDTIGNDNSVENERVIQDTVSYILASFLGYVNPKLIDDPYNHTKRIDKIQISGITEIYISDSNFKELIINHKDFKDYILVKVTVPKNFEIEALHGGWVCSIRNREDKIDGPLSIYYNNFVEMYTTSYINGKEIGTNSIYNMKGEIILQEENSNRH